MSQPLFLMLLLLTLAFPKLSQASVCRAEVSQRTQEHDKYRKIMKRVRAELNTFLRKETLEGLRITGNDYFRNFSFNNVVILRTRFFQDKPTKSGDRPLMMVDVELLIEQPLRAQVYEALGKAYDEAKGRLIINVKGWVGSSDIRNRLPAGFYVDMTPRNERDDIVNFLVDVMIGLDDIL